MKPEERLDALTEFYCIENRLSKNGKRAAAFRSLANNYLRAAAREAGEKMRERCVLVADAQGERWGDDPVALQIAINVAAGIRALPIEEDEGGV